MKINTDQATNLDWSAEQIKKLKIGALRATIVVVLVAILVLTFFGLFPHPYEYFHDVKFNETIRVNKFTGARQRATSSGWQDR